MKLSKALIVALFGLLPMAVSAGERLLVVSSIKPVAMLVSAVAGDTVDSRLLLPPTASPHDFQLRPSEAKLLRRADAVFWVGPRLERFLAGPLASVPAAVALMGADVGQRGGHGHDHGHDDAHVWMSVIEVERMVRRIASVLSARLPQRSAYIHANAARFISELERAHLDLSALLLPVRERRYLLLHDGYSHFERDYRLRHAAVLSGTPDQLPGARHVAALRQRLLDGEFDCVFREPQYEPALLRNLLTGVAVTVIELDPLGLAADSGAEGFLQFYRRLGESFAACGK